MTISRIADELMDAVFDAHPVKASLLGVRDREDRLPDLSEAGEAAQGRRFADLAARAEAVDPASLDEDDRVTRAVVLHQARAELTRIGTRGVEHQVSGSFLTPAAGTLSNLAMLGITEPAHADGYLARLAGLPALFGTLAERHRAGIADGRPPVRRLAEAAVEHVDRHLSAPEDDPLSVPGSNAAPAPGSGTGSSAAPGFDTAAFRVERDRLLAETVRPALARYRDALAELTPHGRPDDRPGLCRLPGGEDDYARLVRTHTTTVRTPGELHRTGLDLLERIDEEYARVGRRVFGTGDPARVRDRLRTDPAMRWRDADELLAATRATVERAERAAPQWFGRLPSRRCEVRPTPASEAPGAPVAHYMQPALDGSRPGTYFVNTHGADRRDRHSAEAIAFHEAVPGHHLQLTIAQELTGLPLLRRLASVTVFDEGWGLYAERLAEEMGLYSDDVARLGMLSEDSLRACRLVADTGLHAEGWSRQRAVDLMTARTATNPLEITSEVDGFLASPGRALAYMVGRLEIQRIRTSAEAVLGERFDVRAFHDTVLGHGPLPMDVLDDVVRAWAGREAAELS